MKKRGDQGLPGKCAEPRILEGETRAYPAGAGKKPTRQVRTGSPGFSKTKEAYPASTGEAGSPKASQKATEGDLPTRQPQTLLEEPESSLFKRTSPLGNPQFSKVSPERRHTRQPLAGMRLILGPPSPPPPSSLASPSGRCRWQTRKWGECLYSTKLAAGLRSVARNNKATRLLTRPG